MYRPYSIISCRCSLLCKHRTELINFRTSSLVVVPPQHDPVLYTVRSIVAFLNIDMLFAIPGVIGASLGAQIGKVFPSTPLLFLFALLMMVVALSMLRSNGSSSPKPMRSGKAMLVWILPVSFTVGLLSGFFGIGGGFLIVPGLVFATGMPLLNAIGTSLFSVGVFGT